MVLCSSSNPELREGTEYVLNTAKMTNQVGSREGAGGEMKCMRIHRKGCCQNILTLRFEPRTT